VSQSSSLQVEVYDLEEGLSSYRAGNPRKLTYSRSHGMSKGVSTRTLDRMTLTLWDEEKLKLPLVLFI
jgi:hypothetical protein